MGFYNDVLPTLFPYYADVDEAQVRQAADLLAAGDDFAPLGSSFAVVPNVWSTDQDYSRRLWVSQSSHTRLTRAGFGPTLLPSPRKE